MSVHAAVIARLMLIPSGKWTAEERIIWDSVPSKNATVAEGYQQLAAERDRLRSIKEELVEALQLATLYVEKTHGVVAAAVGHDNLVLPDLEKCCAVLARAALAASGEVTT